MSVMVEWQSGQWFINRIADKVVHDASVNNKAFTDSFQMCKAQAVCHMCMDICVDMCIDSYTDVCTDTCTDTCEGVGDATMGDGRWQTVLAWTCVKPCCIDMRIDMCRDMCIHMCVDLCMDMCISICICLCSDTLDSDSICTKPRPCMHGLLAGVCQHSRLHGLFCTFAKSCCFALLRSPGQTTA